MFSRTINRADDAAIRADEHNSKRCVVFGNPAIAMAHHRTGSFASPPCDGFALLTARTLARPFVNKGSS